MGVVIQSTLDTTHIEVNTVALRNRIPKAKRKWGMLATVILDGTAENNTTWVLVRGLDDTNKMNNDNWQTLVDYLSSLGISGGGSSTLHKEYFNGNDVQTVFNMGQAGTVMLVEVGGVIQRPVTDYNVAGQAITMTYAPATGQTVGIYSFSGISILTDPLDQVEVDTTGAQITLDAAGKKQRMFFQSDDINGVRQWLMDNEENVLKWSFAFVITGLFAQTLPANTVMAGDGGWNSGAKTWTPVVVGRYVARAEKDHNGDFLVEMIGPNS